MDGKGFVDLVREGPGPCDLLRAQGRQGKLSDDQVAWIQCLTCWAEVYVWRPEHWLDGTIEAALRPRRCEPCPDDARNLDRQAGDEP